VQLLPSMAFLAELTQPLPALG